MIQSPLGWLGVIRLGLAQSALGAIVVVLTSTINRVMVVELALPAIIPGLLMAVHYGFQILRPRWGYGSDVQGRRTPWIIAGMGVLATGGTGAAVATALASSHPVWGLSLALLSFALVGVGVGAAGTNVLALLAARVAPPRRAAAATIVWIMMIFGFAVTAPLAGHFLDPFSPARLVAVTSVVCLVAFCMGTLAVIGIEGPALVAPYAPVAMADAPHARFSAVIRQVWAEPEARRFTIFVFVSMLAYSAQELILEPFAGIVFGMTPGETTKLAGVQHGGVLAGMLTISLVATFIGGPIFGSLRLWTVGGCFASAAALLGVAGVCLARADSLLRPIVFTLGFFNGVFAAAAIASMMALAGAAGSTRVGTRMGLWGAAQGLAFGAGSVVATLAVDISRQLFGSPVAAYAYVFSAEAMLFLAAAMMANRMTAAVPARPDRSFASAPQTG